MDGSSDESKVQELIATSEELHELLLSSKASEVSIKSEITVATVQCWGDQEDEK